MVPRLEFPPATSFTDQVTELLPPVTVAVNCCVPPVCKFAELGETATTSSTVRFTLFEVPPPGAGVDTEIAKVPAEVREEDGTTAVNCPEFTKVVVKLVLPAFTVD